MKIALSFLTIIISLSSIAGVYPPPKSAPQYNSGMDPANATSESVIGSDTFESDIVKTKDSSTVRKKTTRKTMEESCEKIKGKMVCGEARKIHKDRKSKDDLINDSSKIIPETELE